MKIGAIKEETGLPLRCVEREDAVVARAVENSDGTLSSDAVGRLFRAIIEETRSLETLEVHHVG